MRWTGLLACMVLCGCNFDASTSAPSSDQIDGAVVIDDSGVDDSSSALGDGGMLPVDAASPPADASTYLACLLPCMLNDGICLPDGTCQFTCTDSNPCDAVTCPQEVPCSVTCTTTQADTVACGAIACSNAMPCTVTCTNASGQEENNGCQSVSCNNNCSCDVTCTGDNACGSVSCSGGGDTCEIDNGCSGSGAQCNSC